MHKYKIVNPATGKSHTVTCSKTKNLAKVVLPRYKGPTRLYGDVPILIYFDDLYDTDKYVYEAYKLHDPCNPRLDINDITGMLNRIEKAARILGTDDLGWTIRKIAEIWFNWEIPEEAVKTMMENLQEETVY